MLESKPIEIVTKQSMVEQLPRSAKLLLKALYKGCFDSGCGSVHFVSRIDLFKLTIDSIYDFEIQGFSQDLDQLIQLGICDVSLNGNFCHVSETFLEIAYSLTIPLDKTTDIFTPHRSILTRIRSKIQAKISTFTHSNK
jgi:hypothetical protein